MPSPVYFDSLELGTGASPPYSATPSDQDDASENHEIESSSGGEDQLDDGDAPANGSPIISLYRPRVPANAVEAAIIKRGGAEAWLRVKAEEWCSRCLSEKGAICLRNPERDACLRCTCSKKGKDKCHLPSAPTPARASRPRGKGPSAPADTSKGKRRAHSNDMMETRGAKRAPAVGKGALKLTVKIPPPSPTKGSRGSRVRGNASSSGAAGKGKAVALPVKKRKIVPLDAGGIEVDENEGRGYGNAGDDQAGGDNDETHDDNGETTNETRPPTSLLSQRAPYPLMAALSLGPGDHTPWWTVTDVGLTCLGVPESVEALRTLETQIRLQASCLQVLGTQHLEAAAQCTEAAEVVRYMIDCNDEQSLGETLESARRARDSRREEYRERREAERIEQAQREAERIEQAQREAERIKNERRREEEERIANERRREEEERGREEEERIENERIENERRREEEERRQEEEERRREEEERIEKERRRKAKEAERRQVEEQMAELQSKLENLQKEDE
ncbi:hypothetical protein OE88DRAFT_1739917 [Heliocybe sulcata]|uniref:Uncharacterized protein n=1 Tax=Heliocybe sulcata TaxID=5364 RepID=A0A5C3MMN4_9AGAM|nr:hypothetical protein OE88DRAFT_1739917 [Heliocybe sulcata]